MVPYNPSEDGLRDGRSVPATFLVENCFLCVLGSHLVSECCSHSGSLAARTRHEDPHFISSLKTLPPFMTNFTRCNSVISFSGSPETATKSAHFPASTVPILF